MKKYMVLCIVVFLVLIVAVISIWYFPFIVYRDRLQIANEYIEKIEHFKSLNKHTPSSLMEIGEEVSEKNLVYYQRINDMDYRIWFGTTLGESIVYDSKTKKWK